MTTPMKTILPIFLAALALPALADTTLNFESLANGTDVLNSYASQHIVFSDNAKSFRSASLATNPGTGNFYGGAAGSEQSAITLFDRSNTGSELGATLRITLADGFGTHFSVSVAALSGSLISATAFDAAGNRLGGDSSSDFDGACANGFCDWAPLEFDVMGRAAYVELSADEGSAWFDDMAFGALPSGGSGNDVPEPNGILLSAAALAALAGSRRRVRR